MESRLATLLELQTQYGSEDLYILIEIETVRLLNAAQDSDG